MYCGRQCYWGRSSGFYHWTLVSNCENWPCYLKAVFGNIGKASSYCSLAQVTVSKMGISCLSTYYFRRRLPES